MVIRRGDIHWSTLATPRGSEPGYRRPVLVVSSDAFNRSRINTVVVVAISSNLGLAQAPGNVRLPSDATGLSKDSVANVSQVITLDKSGLDERVGSLDRAHLGRVEVGLSLVLDLSDK